MQVFNEFTQRMSAFAKVKYDILDLDEPAFQKDYSMFYHATQDLERRIG
jgi:adenine-specific DNA methylase